MYLTFSPCLDGAKLIIQSGIRRVVYSKEYRIKHGIRMLNESDVSIEHIEV